MSCAFPARWSGNVEAVIGTLPAVFRLPPAAMDALKVELVRDSFAYHYQANAWFRRECVRQPLTPDDLHKIPDLQRIPLIPVQTFKRPDAAFLLSVPLDAIDLEIQST